MSAKKKDETSAETPRPTLGRIVHVLPDDDTAEPLAAIVTIAPADGEDRLHVCAFDPIYGPRTYEITGYSETYPPARGCWAWPPRD